MSSAKLDQFRKLVQIDPNETTFFGLGRACMDEGNEEEAVRAFRRAIELKPDYTAAFLLLGEALQNLNRAGEAVEVYTRGLEVARITRDEIPRRKMEKRLKRLKRRQGAAEGTPE